MVRRTSVLIVIVAVLLAACGGGGNGVPAASPSSAATTPTARPTATPEPLPTGFVQSFEQCSAVLQPAIDVLSEINARLTSTEGINVKDYGPLVEAVPLTDPDRLSGGTNRFCRNILANHVASVTLDHMNANEGWNNCLSFPASMQQPCIDMIVQRWWSKASMDYTQVQADMMNLNNGVIPPLDPDPSLDLQEPPASHAPDELASMSCDREFSPVIRNLFELARVLAEGTTLDDYGAWVRATTDELQKVDTDGLDGTCLISIEATVRTILNDHTEARDAWRVCASKATQAKYDACVEKTVQSIWGGRLTSDYTKLFDSLGTMAFNQLGLLRPSWLPHSRP